jgi:hypothetical protein
MALDTESCHAGCHLCTVTVWSMSQISPFILSHPSKYHHPECHGARNPYRGGRISTVDLLELTSLDQLLSILKQYFPFLHDNLS